MVYDAGQGHLRVQRNPGVSYLPGRPLPVELGARGAGRRQRALRGSDARRYDDTWYVFSVEQETVFGTRLHYADSLRDGDWTEHPASPIATAARNRRPAGRPVVLDDGLFLFFQDVERTYGDEVRCFEVETLTESEYAHSELSQSPVLESTGDGGWRHEGMHHVDPGPATTGVENVVAVDGKDADNGWSIGVYRLVDDGE